MGNVKTSTNEQLKVIRTAKHAEFYDLKKSKNTDSPEETKDEISTQQTPNQQDPNIQKALSPPKKIPHISINSSMVPKITSENEELSNSQKLPHYLAGRQNAHHWPQGTVAIAGDSIIGGLVEAKMSRKKRIKVRSFSGANIRDMYDNLKPILRKAPTYLIIHAHTNSITEENTAEELFTELESLVGFATSYQESETNTIPDIRLSTPTIRGDNTQKQETSLKLANMIKNSKYNAIDNSNITTQQLASRGLHLNLSGTKSLAMNIISYVRENLS